MRLALIRQKYTDFGGAERYLSGLARRLVAVGHEVHILAREWRATEQEGLIFHRIPCSGPTFLRMPAFARGAARVVIEGGFDLVHGFDRTACQDIYRAGDGCHREYLLRRARVFGWGRRWLDRISLRHRAILELEARLFADPRLKLVLVNSRRGGREIQDHYGLPDEKIRLLHNGVDRAIFYFGLAEKYRAETRRELNLDPTEPVALFLGSGFARKGLGELLPALVHAPLKLLVVGKDRLGPYQALATRLGVADRAVFLGPRTDVPRLYGAADVFVLPSWYEPFSNACLEALAAGLPLVTTRETGAAEVVTEGVNGFLSDFPVNPAALAEKLSQALLLDRALVRAENDRLLASFDWEENLARTLAAYEEILRS